MGQQLFVFAVSGINFLLKTACHSRILTQAFDYPFVGFLDVSSSFLHFSLEFTRVDALNGVQTCLVLFQDKSVFFKWQ